MLQEKQKDDEGSVSMNSSVTQQIVAARKKLLDTSSRNRLINYKGSKTVGAEVQEGESADHIFDLLVTKGKAMRFEGVPDQEGLIDVDTELPRPKSAVSDDDILTCRDLQSKLKKKLLKTFRDQRTLMEETGVNTLFLAIGKLKWVDPSVQKGDRSSPLLLISVNLERNGLTDQYKLSWDGQDVIQNLSLAVLMQDQFGIQFPELTISEETKPTAAFQQLETLATSRGWQVVADEISLAFFSSAKYLMYADLDPTKWANSLDKHPDLQVLLNPDPDRTYSSDFDGLPEGSKLDQFRPVDTCHEVVDCDGSQLLALLEATRGKTMVIEGPPGTGKSQTITNLLADFVARGKTVLFVAEKQAALNVVARNLERVGLRSLCLELHSHNTNKAKFYKEIVETLTALPPNQDQTVSRADLQRIRDGLNQYAAAINSVVESFGLTPREIMGAILKLGEDTSNGHRLPDAEAICSKELLVKRREVAQAIDRWISASGKPSEHCFHFVTRYLDPVDRQQLITELGRVKDSLEQLVRATATAATLVQTDQPSSIDEVLQLQRAMEAIAERPDLVGLKLAVAKTTNREEVRGILEAGCRRVQLHGEWKSVLTSEAVSSDLVSLAGQWRSLQSSPFKWINPTFFRLRKQIDALSRIGFSDDHQRGSALRAALELKELDQSLQASASTLTTVFAGVSGKPSEPWEARRAAWEWFEKSIEAVSRGYLPASFFEQPTDLNQRAVEENLIAIRSTHELLNQGLGNLECKGATLSFQSLSELRSLLQVALEKQGTLSDWVTYLDLEGQLGELGVPSLISLSREGIASDQVVARSYFEKAIKAAYQHPALRSFSLPTQETQIERFRELDQLLLIANREKIRGIHRNGVPSGHGGAGGVGVLQREATKQRRHQSIRKTMQTAWPAIQRIKPIFMMSPVSVSMYLPQDGPQFDVVIFDEASQVRPEEAIGAIARAKQAIVVGDSKQMPPTSFFEKMTQDTDADEDEVEEATAGLESILDVVSTRIPKTSPSRKSLRWHYRSRHESLITPSNGLFYDWKLFIVPNPAPPNHEVGLIYHHLPGAIYDRGKSRTNREEARAVVAAIMENLRSRPHESVMAVAFSTAQQQAIQDELDLELGRSPGLHATYQGYHPTEPLDVKNLENVQGDERDVVLISIGYGRGEQGYISQTFGPLNQEGGGRRMNVLITRARRRCEVFTNLEPEDIKAEGNQGRHALKTFLTYARSGHMDIPNTTGREPMSIFEEQVLDALRSEGYDCEPQVGVAGFFIDIGVRHPEQPQRYCLGIECDGAQYHSSLTARDRDRLRQSVLESRGWIIHRIWSTDWFGDPKGCLHRTLEAIKAACEHKAEVFTPVVASPATPDPIVASGFDQKIEPSVPKKALTFEPYEYSKVAASLVWEYDWLLAHSAHVINAMKSVIVVEAPISMPEVIRRLRESCGGGRSGSRIAPLLTSLAERIVIEGIARKGGWFLPQSGKAKPRDRKHLEAPYRKPELIHDLEIMAAMGRLVEAEVVVPRDRLVKEALRLLGIGRVSQDASARLDTLIDRSIKEGWIVETSAGLILPN